MGEWVDIDLWAQCASMERPGIIFEVVNAEAQSLFTPCVEELTIPYDWTSGPLKFRAVEEAKPRHSEPLPEPVQAPPASKDPM